MVANGGAPAYGQPVWVPNMHAAAPPPSAGMIRSPYGPQMVPYPLARCGDVPCTITDAKSVAAKRGPRQTS
ncbi:hypothetical protein NUW54_g2007 [Trametes sanguinea]|uniref:Uncharacterized protein n=1 Tax=Trametes sanguinea TaxID=158606 RepID=A0ACC1Q4S7_9APHY|nr:hypothetical protein NUW54_g2007 [Trametes sanguinea]